MMILSCSGLVFGLAACGNEESTEDQLSSSNGKGDVENICLVTGQGSCHQYDNNPIECDAQGDQCFWFGRTETYKGTCHNKGDNVLEEALYTKCTATEYCKSFSYEKSKIGYCVPLPTTQKCAALDGTQGVCRVGVPLEKYSPCLTNEKASTVDKLATICDGEFTCCLSSPPVKQACSQLNKIECSKRTPECRWLGRSGTSVGECRTTICSDITDNTDCILTEHCLWGKNIENKDVCLYDCSTFSTKEECTLEKTNQQCFWLAFEKRGCQPAE